MAVLCGLLFLLCACAAAAADQSGSPLPTPSPKPVPFAYRAFLRSYAFSRTNASSYRLPQANGVFNQFSSNTALSLHGSYQFAHRWSIGATYLYANPLNGCASAADQLQTGGPCSGKGPPYERGAHYSPMPTNPDNTLPGFELSTWYEAYVEYHDAHVSARAGNQLLTTPWANGADTRLKPASYQGAAAAVVLSPQWILEGAVIWQFESRVESAFGSSTLLTATNRADAPGPGQNLLIPKYSSIPTAGFRYLHAEYVPPHVEANAYFYDFVDIATAVWFDGKWSMTDAARKPFLALQAGTEHNSGRSVIGKIDSQVIGVQGGITPIPNLDVAIGADYIAEKRDTMRLPAGVQCGLLPSQPPSKPPTGHEIVVTGTTPFAYFLPAGGTPNCITNADGSTAVYYGGWASPYTDSYTSDPLYTTSMTNGMVERRSPGTSAKVTATWWGNHRRLRFIASFASYHYGNSTTGFAPAHETDLDGTYYCNAAPQNGVYHGLLLRYRYGDRDLANVRYYGGLPVFKYNRLQLEYDL